MSSHNRKATTTIETVIAVALLASAIALIGRFVASVQQGLADRELSAQLGWEISNARELVGSWTPETISVERIEAIPLSAAITSRLPDARWRAVVTQITDPAHAVQVDLQLACAFEGQRATPAELTFWVEREIIHD